MINICMTLLLALAGLSNSQSSDRYLTLKVFDTDEKKVSKIIVTCKENCAPVPSVDGVIKLKLPPRIHSGDSITLEIVKHPDHPNWMIVSPPGGRAPAPAPGGKADEVVSLSVVNVGKADSDSAKRLDELARRYFTQAKYDEAESLCRKALEINEQALGPEHEETVEILRHLAFVYEEQKKFAEAGTIHERALKINEKTRPEQPETADSLTNLADIYYHQGKYKERIPLYKRAFDIYEKALGFDHPKTSECFNYLIKLYLSENQQDDLDLLYRHAVDIYEKTSGGMMSDRRRKNIIEIFEQYGQFLLQHYWQRDFREAMKLIARAYDLREGMENSGADAKIDPKRQMKRYLRSMGPWGLSGDQPSEIREYKHPLLSKYLPDHTFYIAYIPASPAVYEEDGKTLKQDKFEGGYFPCLGVADRENRLTVFNNLVRIPIAEEYRKHWPLIEDFMTRASIKRFASARTDDEMREITRMYLILSQLKGLDGFGINFEDKKGLPVIRDPKTEEFKVKKEEGQTTVSYVFEGPEGQLQAELSFDREGNITEGRAGGLRTNISDRLRRTQ